MGRRPKGAASDWEFAPTLAAHLRGRVRWNSYRRRYEVRGADDTWTRDSMAAMKLVWEVASSLPADERWGPLRNKAGSPGGARRMLEILRMRGLMEHVVA